MADEPLPGGSKLQIYLLYTTDWVATGSGYDNRIGALWVSPATCQPVGSVIAHEIGHCFQYLTYCQALESGSPDDSRAGFRYGYAENAGNVLWEIGAQWQSWQSYPEEMFTDYEMETWFQQYHRALENEYTRYQNYWWFYALTEQYGLDAYSRIWRESAYPEDAYQTFMRLYLDNDLNAFYDTLYRYASHAVTFDFAAAAPYTVRCRGRLAANRLCVLPGSERLQCNSARPSRRKPGDGVIPRLAARFSAGGGRPRSVLHRGRCHHGEPDGAHTHLQRGGCRAGLALRLRGVLGERHTRVQRFLRGAGGRGVLRYPGGDAISVFRRAGCAGKLSGARLGQRRSDGCADAV